MTGEDITSVLKSNPVSVACGALAITLAVATYFRSDRVPEAEATLDQKATLGERIDANLKNGVQLADQYAQITASRQQIEARLVRPDEIAKNLQFFYKLEAETSTKLIDLRQNVMPTVKVKPKGYYQPVGYSIAVRGDYIHLLDFLRRLESGQRFCRVHTATIGLTGSTDKDRGNDLTVTLGIELLGQP